MPPPPAKWTGLCEFNKSGGCSNKVIGARNFESGSKGMPPFDEGGHGSHTASIAAGNFVKHANVLGNAKGTAAGVAPGAHLAIYKICTDEGCAGADILAAFDAAIADGVDVLSVSVGQKSTPFYDDAIAVGAFAAIRKGILVSCSAGNYGPTSASVGNAAPWILTVGTVNVADVEGKVVLCDSDGKTSITDKGRVVKQAGGVAMIVANSDLAGSTTIALEHVLPASHVSYSAGLSIKAYISSTSHPTASIAFEGTIIGEPSAPEVIFFSARGPSLATPGILKPDIIGPGMNILAAWPTPLHNNSPSKLTFNLLSGTSMSCPHLSGVAALIKSSHPDWSPAAIKSAIMTTADILNLKDSPILDQTEHPAKGRRLLYSYRHVISGFAARLTEEEVKAMEKKDGFVSATPEKIYHLHTTRTPGFLGLHNRSGFWKGSNFGEGVIIGILDTGVYPQHPSFSDEGMPLPPAKWTGTCEFNGTACNNKLIGARNFDSLTPKQLPIDEEGHGTHTASTAAGNYVKHANMYGNAKGTAAGIAPRAHVAVYKVCGLLGCGGSDILAAYDAAIEDGVDVLSLSLGGESSPFYDDPVALAASTLDRSITATAKLGNTEEFDGESLYQPRNFSSKLLPLVYAGANGNQTSAYCAPGSLKNLDVKGKVVVCDRGGDIGRTEKGVEVKNAGGAAMILANSINDSFSTFADPHVLPATHVSYAAGLKIKAYTKSTSNPSATILFKGTNVGVTSAPQITSFSSRGPSIASPGILKPDITGPGVSILAAWPAPLLNPILDDKHMPADLFAIGAGHVNPSKANDPGLIYDIEPYDYIPYLCGLGYTNAQVEAIVLRKVNCSKESSIPEAELNYPSFSIALGSKDLKFKRVVTNVGKPHSSYAVSINAPEGVDVVVKPTKIHFNKVYQKKSYTVIFRSIGGVDSRNRYAQGFLKWVSATHSAKSPISVTQDFAFLSLPPPPHPYIN
ncbi:unnamed protein product, partial [Vitis vinifera]